MKKEIVSKKNQLEKIRSPRINNDKKGKLSITDKLTEKLKKLRANDPNIYPLW